MWQFTVECDLKALPQPGTGQGNSSSLRRSSPLRFFALEPSGSTECPRCGREELRAVDERLAGSREPNLLPGDSGARRCTAGAGDFFGELLVLLGRLLLLSATVGSCKSCTRGATVAGVASFAAGVFFPPVSVTLLRPTSVSMRCGAAPASPAPSEISTTSTPPTCLSPDAFCTGCTTGYPRAGHSVFLLARSAFICASALCSSLHLPTSVTAVL
mmetsp:Transcript_22650/g.89611  ORF Transcript_22650/g.89611 Transcript_22650/m.89611 type:complete len:215 (-) Transcript_22650:8-652(-)